MDHAGDPLTALDFATPDPWQVLREAVADELGINPDDLKPR